MKRILLIEDDRDIVELVKYNLSRDGFDVVAVGDGASGLAQLRKSPPDLLILDLMLPKLPGLEVCKEIRRDQKLNRLPILMLSARGEEAVTKPFSPRELLARVRALLRRMEPSAADGEKPITRGTLQLDPASFRVTRDGDAVPMSTLEFRLLYFLASHPDRVYSRDQLLDAVWGSERFVTPRSVDVYVRRIRKKVELDPERPAYLKTLRGAGYIFQGRAE